MNRQSLNQTNQPSEGDTSSGSWILQRAAVRVIPEQEIDQTQKAGEKGFTESRFNHDFSRLPLHSVHQIVEPGIQQIGKAEQPEVQDNQEKIASDANSYPSVEDSLTSFSEATKGQPSQIAFRPEMEDAFGENFSGVKMYLGQSVQMKQLSARAATQGEKIAFASNNPDKKLVAHELTHVVQNRRFGVQNAVQGKSEVSDPNSTDEQEADVIANQVAEGKQVKVQAKPAAGIQRSYESLSPMGKTRVDSQAERTYTQKTEELEFKMGPMISKEPTAHEIVNKMLDMVKQIVDAWAKATGKEAQKDDVYVREFTSANTEKYYGAFNKTAENIKKVLNDKYNQPLRTKLHLIYNVISNNNLSKYLEIAALELERAVKGIKAPQKIYTSGNRLTQDPNWESQLTEEAVQPGFSEASGLKTILEKDKSSRQKKISDIAEKRKWTSPLRQNEKISVFAPDTFSEVHGLSPELNKANKYRRGGQSDDLLTEEKRTLKVGDVKDLTIPEIEQYHSTTGKTVPKIANWIAKNKFNADKKDTKIFWEQGREYYDVILNSEVDKQATKIKARLEAGISGSTDLLLHAANNLGLDQNDKLKLRLALVGWMLSNRDHSFYEIMIAAKNYGLPFYIDENKIGSEYEDSQNFKPMEIKKIKELLPEKQFPSYFLSKEYKNKLAAGLTEPDKSVDQYKDDLVSLSDIPKTITDQMSERDITELYQLDIVVKTTQFDKTRSNNSGKNNKHILRNLKEDSAFLYLARKFPAHSELMLKTLMDKHHGVVTINNYLGGLPSYKTSSKISVLEINQNPSEIKKELVTVGIPGEYIDNREDYEIYELQKFQFLVKNISFDNSGNPGSYNNNFGLINLLSGEPLLRQNFGSPQGDIILANLLTHYHTKQVFNDIVDAGIPRGYVEKLPKLLQIYAIYNLQEFQKEVNNTGFNQSDTDNKIKMASLKRSPMNQLLTNVFGRQADLFLAALVRHYHPNVRLLEGQQYLADFAELMVSHEDRERTGKSRQLTPKNLSELEVPRPLESEKDSYWAGKTATESLKVNAQAKSLKNQIQNIILNDLKSNKHTQPMVNAKNMSDTIDKSLVQTSNLEEAIRLITELLENLQFNALSTDVKKSIVKLITTEWEEAANLTKNVRNLKQLDEKELGAIMQYTGTFYKPLIEATASLETKDFKKDDFSNPKATEWETEGGGQISTLRFANPMLKALISGLDKLPAYQGKVYRGEQSKQDLKNQTEDYRKWYAQSNYPVGKVDFRTYPTSTSTTKDATKKAPEGEKFDIIYEISDIKTGKSVELLSTKPDEQEVLFAPGVRFEVVRTESKDSELWVYMREL
ncbi:hypothetical protein NIES2100_05960 [Calothrix sp. NIES-2100]|uniref:eCIS core domain-containing protein n=1 Tax=Calothrix sp. NIES-2100 TaxID=1954172 RepID=UPI000B602E44|nr:hypothetical protein NIES2100_05960 [Calothrix sp. NIES-2100]